MTYNGPPCYPPELDQYDFGECPTCNGVGTIDHTLTREEQHYARQDPFSTVCPQCGGKGFINEHREH